MKRPSTTAVALKAGAGFWTVATMFCSGGENAGHVEERS